MPKNTMLGWVIARVIAGIQEKKISFLLKITITPAMTRQNVLILICFPNPLMHLTQT
jgi:hypothetical protein